MIVLCNLAALGIRHDEQLYFIGWNKLLNFKIPNNMNWLDTIQSNLIFENY